MSARRRERWYSLDGQRRSYRQAMDSSKGPRQLLSLIVLLVLTFIAIRQVSDPQRVERVATAVGLLPTSQNNALSPFAPPPSEDAVAAEDPRLVSWTLASSRPTIETRAQVLEQLLGTAPPGLVSALAYDEWIAKDSKIANRTISDNQSKDRAEWLASAKERLTRWIELSDSLSVQHAILSNLWEFLDRMSDSLATQDAVPEDQQESLVAYHLALERALVRQFADNTPWRSTDRNPLMRTMQRAVTLGEAIQSGELVPEMIPAIAVPQLMGDTDVFRGRAIRIAGRIAQVDPSVSLAIDDPRTQSYQVLWLRPDDGSNQPIIVHVPSGLNLPPDQTKKEDSILVCGMVTKRRAYASQRGGEIAPVIVAAHIQPFQSRDRETQTRFSEDQQRLALRWRSVLADNSWRPPVDIGGAVQRIEQRVGKRARELQTTLAHPVPPAPSNPQRLDALARDERVQAILTGLHQVSDDLQLLSQANWQPIDGSVLPLMNCSGWVTRVQRIAIDKEPFPGWQWKELYACTLQENSAPNAASTCIVLTSHVPTAWRDVPRLRQPAVAMGWTCEIDGNPDSKFMISPNVQWRRSDNESGNEIAPNLPSGWKTLLDRGWNLTWIDTLESLQGKPMTARESEPFYRLLNCSVPPADPHADRAGPTLSILQAIQRAESRKSNRSSTSDDASSSGYRAQGVVQVRRIQRIQVPGPDERSWLGADHYYQLDGFADIGPNRISVRYEEADEPIVFEKEFPITLVARKVPDRLLIDAEEAIPGQTQAWYPRTRIAIEGWFYRMWRFKTTQVSEATDDKEAQLGPMVIVDQFEAAPAPATAGASNLSPAWITAITSMIGLVGGLWILVQIRRGLRQPRSRR